MKNLLATLAALGLGAFVIGCGEAKKTTVEKTDGMSTTTTSPVMTPATDKTEKADDAEKKSEEPETKTSDTENKADDAAAKEETEKVEKKE